MCSLTKRWGRSSKIRHLCLKEKNGKNGVVLGHLEGELLKKKMEGEQEMPAVLLMEQGGEVIGSRRDEISHFIPFLTLRWYVLKVGIGDAGVLNNLSTDLFTSMGYIFSVLLQ